MRMLALAHAWREGSDTRVTFLCAELPEALCGRIRAAGCTVVMQDPPVSPKVDAEVSLGLIASACAPRDCHIVVDGYRFPSAFQRPIHGAGCRLMVMDDNGENGSYDCDVILNQNIGAYEGLYSDRRPDTRLLLGTRYALLRPEFVAMHNVTRRPPGSGFRLLVTMGGADPADGTGMVLDALALLGCQDATVTVVIGAGNPRQEYLERKARRLHWKAVEVLRGVDDMACLMHRADAAITAGGSTCWELCLLGVPMLALATADNQRDIVRGLAAAGASLDGGDVRHSPPEDMVPLINVLLADAARRTDLSSCARSIVDGLGARRVRDAVLGVEEKT